MRPFAKRCKGDRSLGQISRPLTADERFILRTVYGLGCWEWRGSFFRSGYGQFTLRNPEGGRKNWSAPRFSWTRTNGPIPPGLSVLHRCDNRKCVRPDHLFLGTHQDNMADMKAKGRARSGRKNPTKREVTC